ncbi:hypothetical protein Efla_007708 [Eimeria flavescens]
MRGPQAAQQTSRDRGAPAGSGRPPEAASASGLPEAARSPRVHLHEIRPADTLLSIAAQYDVPVQELMQLNRLNSSDIWFHRYLTIPCRQPACLADCSSSRPLPAAAPAAASSSSSSSSGACRSTAGITTGSGSSEFLAASRLGVGDAAARGAADESQQGPPCSEDPGGPPAGGAPAGALSEDLQESANLAMLVEALVRETDIHPRIARQRITTRSLNYDAALRDCFELRRWAAEMDLTASEILAYLVIHNGDIDRAYTALIEDDQWHNLPRCLLCLSAAICPSPAAADSLALLQGLLEGGPSSSSSWLSHLRPNFLLGVPRGGSYRRVASDAPAHVVGAPSAARGGARPCSRGAPRVGGARAPPFPVTSADTPACSRFGHARGDGSAALPQFNSTSLEALRRRPVGSGQRGPPPNSLRGPQADAAAPFSAAVARGAPPTPAVGSPVCEASAEEADGKHV